MFRQLIINFSISNPKLIVGGDLGVDDDDQFAAVAVFELSVHEGQKIGGLKNN
jgi:hypothetical protein